MSAFASISRSGLFSLALVLWTGLTVLVIHNSYQQERDLAFQQLENLTTKLAYEIEQDPQWQTSYALQSGIAQIQQWQQSIGFYFDLSLIQADGKPVVSTLIPTSTLGFVETARYLNSGSDIALTQCQKMLSGYPTGHCHICSRSLGNGTSLVLSLTQSNLITYWVQDRWLIIATSLFTILLLVCLHLLLSVRYHHSKLKQGHLATQVERQESEFKRLLRNLPGLIYRMNARSKKVVYMSPGSLALVGYQPEQFIEQKITPMDIIEEEDQERLQNQIRLAHQSLKPFELVYRVRTLHGELKWVIDRGNCYLDADGEYYVEGVILDITERELVRQQIEYLAIQDPLTELYNRYKFNDELVSAVDETKRQEEHFAMLFIDLDRFKNINDSLGHQLGDRLLREVSDRLRKIVKEEQFLGRMGGDEFVILMRHLSNTDEARDLAREINRVLRQPFNIESYELRISCSIGIALCPDDSDESHILWRYADTAMYQVKKHGGNGYQFFTSEMSDQVQYRLKIEHSFIPALKQKQFELYYQPQVDIETGELKGAEALIRWMHPELGFISPAEFIPVAEETGFIHDLGKWILRDALSQLAEWQKFVPDLSIAVNISARQITDEFPEGLEKLISEFNVKKNTLELEITESLLMENIDFVQPLLNDVRDKDVSFAIDDFGTGYSSLSYLRYLPINKLKIDRAFVKNLEHNQDDIAMVRAIISMGKNLGISVLAEGIENQAQLAILKEQGCDAYQGYLFSRPLEKNQFYKQYVVASDEKVTHLNRS